MNKFILFLSFLFSVFTYGQRYSFKSYSIPEGLPQTQVKAITEDENGYLWIGTLGGLSRFNGSEFQNFSTEDGLLNNRITFLFHDQHQVWIGHEGGVTLFQKGKFSTWKFEDQNKRVAVTGIVRFKNELTIVTNGAGIYVIKRNKLHSYFLSNEDQNRIRDCVVKDDNLYLATRAGLFVTKDLKKYSQKWKEKELNLTGIVQRNGALFLSGINGELFSYTPDNERLKLLFKLNGDIYIKSLFLDKSQTIWLSHIGGLDALKADQTTFSLNQRNGLQFSSMNVVFEDKNGTLWLGTDGGGLLRFAGKQIVHFTNEIGQLESNLVTSSSTINAQSMLFGSYDNGAYIYQKGKFSKAFDTKNIIWDAISLSSGIWYASDVGLIHKIGNKSTIYDFESGAPGGNVTCFYRSSKGKVYVGGSDGLSEFLPSMNGVISLTPDFNSTLVGTIRDMIEYKGKLLVAADGGMYRFSNGKFQRFLKHQARSFSLDIDSKGVLWIGTEDGLFYYNGKNMQRKSLSQQPAANFINFIEHNKTHSFIGTNNGLYVLSSSNSNKHIIQHLGIEEGVVNLETNINSSCIDGNGFLWFGTASGLVKFDTKVLNNQPQLKTSIQIKGLKINFEDVDLDSLGKTDNASMIPSFFQLKANKNNLIIELDGVQLKNHGELRFTYWLEGLDEQWSPLSRNPSITLSNLPSGEYKLHIKAVNISGEKSKELILHFEILPVFYKTWWFISLLVLIVSGIVLLVFRYRINREREERYKESLEFKTKLLTLEQQSLNASMNRHFIFNSLNSIQYFINSQDKYSANKYLTNFAKLIRMNLDATADGNNTVPLSEEIERLELYLSLESMRFKDRFDFRIDTDGVDLESIEVPAMLFQPFVENSIIHGVLPVESRKGLIEILFEEDENQLIVTIQDNGIGIENSIQKKQDLSGDHRSQGMEITAKRISILNRESAVGFELEGPIQLNKIDRSLNGTRVLLKIPLKKLQD